MSKSILIPAAFAARSLLSVSSAAAAPAPKPVCLPLAAPTYSVPGIRIGMTVKQVMATAQSAKLKITDSSPTETFAQAVDLAQHRPVAQQSGVLSLTLTNGVGNRIFVKFTQFPEGGRVSYLRFTVAKASYTPDEANAVKGGDEKFWN